MSENNFVIQTKNLHKDYILYPSPSLKVRDMLGLMRKKTRKKFPVKKVLRGIDLEVRKGEKICIIGQNGAGKSTLLKIFSGLTSPTRGTIMVNGNAKALLQIGSGFYHELSGRDNAAAYLSQQGIKEKDIPRMINEIIEFSELEEYIDQPTKVYSSGMAARLMFATSISVIPELLILDEILSVGDAYFTQKCIDKIKSLCENDNTTLLLVSHDIYSASKLVDRMIWLENGKIEFDGHPKKIIPVYEDSVRIQEEKRLRKKSMNLYSEMYHCKNKLVLVELTAKNSKPLANSFYVCEIKLLVDNEEIVVNLEKNDSCAGIVAETSWGDCIVFKKNNARMIKNYGSCFPKASIYFNLTDQQLSKILENGATLSLLAYSNEKIELCATVHYNNDIIFSNIVSSNLLKSWDLLTIIFNQDKNNYTKLKDRYSGQGSNSVTLEKIEILNQSNNPVAFFKTGETIKFSLKIKRNDPKVSSLDIFISLVRDGIENICNISKSNFEIGSDSATIIAEVENFGLGVGLYTISVKLTKAGYTETKNPKFYSINPDVYYSHRNLASVQVNAYELAAHNIAYVANANWQVTSQLDMPQFEDVQEKLN